MPPKNEEVTLVVVALLRGHHLFEQGFIEILRVSTTVQALFTVSLAVSPEHTEMQFALARPLGWVIHDTISPSLAARLLGSCGTLL